MKRIEHFLKSANVKLTALALLAGLVLTAALQTFELNLFEAFFYDLRIKYAGSRPISGKVAIVEIDDRTIEKLNELSPLSLKQHVGLLELLGQGKPKAISYLVNFNDSTLAEGGNSAFKTAERFVDTAENLTANGTSVMIGTELDPTGEVVIPPFPLSRLPHFVSILHKDGNTFAEDKITRRALFSVYEEPTLHVQLASLANGITNIQNYRNVYYMPEVDARYFYINYPANTQDGKNQYAVYSVIDLLEGRVPVSVLQDKIVLVGTRTKEDSNDYVYTPFSRQLFTNSKLVVHASILETLLSNRAIRQVPKWVDSVLTLILTFMVTLLVFRTTPGRGVLITILSALGVVALGLVTWKLADDWIVLSRPLLGVFFAYYVFVPYRLIVEYKQRWQFQRKNEVLLQVEELKSNFMSLITHDLKTPVARIQGMAEIISRNSTNDSMHELAGTILDSTEELNSFITSILELAKIESNKVKLSLQSKDINRVIEDSLKKFEFQLKQKNINVKMDLEPLFPIQMDVPLISKVVSNIVDNAIKYSPPGSNIAISSKESGSKNGFVEVSVADSGYGIAAKDLENIFSKFYRPKNDLTMQTKGTGLGLYLSKYFVELHKGKIEVVSNPKGGTTFTISIKNNLTGENYV